MTLPYFSVSRATSFANSSGVLATAVRPSRASRSCMTRDLTICASAWLSWFTVARGVPLPLASVENRRSLVYVGNLVSAIVAAVDAQQAGGTYLVRDGEDLSTPGLVRAIAHALGVEARLLPCPPMLLRAAAAVTGRSAEVARLTGSLVVDNSKIRRELGWRPTYSLEEGLAETARWFRAQSQG